MKAAKLIRSKICHNVNADESDILNNGWHKGWRKPDSQTVAFYYKRQWWASVPSLEKVQGPFNTKEEALNAKSA